MFEVGKDIFKYGFSGVRSDATTRARLKIVYKLFLLAFIIASIIPSTSSVLVVSILTADLDNRFVIECDGVEDKTPSKVSNMKKQAIIERSGLKVSRISKREWQYSQKACIDRIINCNE